MLFTQRDENAYVKPLSSDEPAYFRAQGLEPSCVGGKKLLELIQDQNKRAVIRTDDQLRHMRKAGRTLVCIRYSEFRRCLKQSCSQHCRGILTAPFVEIDGARILLFDLLDEKRAEQRRLAHARRAVKDSETRREDLVAKEDDIFVAAFEDRLLTFFEWSHSDVRCRWKRGLDGIV
jgi:hypothetical protein